MSWKTCAGSIPKSVESASSRQSRGREDMGHQGEKLEPREDNLWGSLKSTERCAWGEAVNMSAIHLGTEIALRISSWPVNGEFKMRKRGRLLKIPG